MTNRDDASIYGQTLLNGDQKQIMNPFLGAHMAEQRKTFGDYLVNLGVITVDQLIKVLQEQRHGEERLEQVILRIRYADPELVFQCLADFFHLPFVDLSTYQIDEKLLDLIPEEVVRRHTLI